MVDPTFYHIKQYNPIYYNYKHLKKHYITTSNTLQELKHELKLNKEFLNTDILNQLNYFKKYPDYYEIIIKKLIEVKKQTLSDIKDLETNINDYTQLLEKITNDLITYKTELIHLKTYKLHNIKL